MRSALIAITIMIVGVEVSLAGDLYIPSRSFVRPSIVLRTEDCTSRGAVGPMISALTEIGCIVFLNASDGPTPDYLVSVKAESGRGARRSTGLGFGKIETGVQRESVWASVEVIVLETKGFQVVAATEAVGVDTATSWRGDLDFGRHSGLLYESREKPSPNRALVSACREIAEKLAPLLQVGNFNPKTGVRIPSNTCPECGGGVQPQWNFCIRCGCPLKTSK